MNEEQIYMISAGSSLVSIGVFLYFMRVFKLPWWVYLLGFFMITGIIYKGLIETEQGKEVIKR